MKRRFRLMVTWLCVFSVLFGLLPGTVLNAETLNSNDELTWPNPGAIQLTKKATPSVGKQGEWEITLTVEGMNLKSGSSDVVLVIDKSGSMNSSRLSKAKEAAKKFVDNLLIESSETRIAVVAFNDSHQTVIGFTGKDQKEQLKQAIEGIKANDGTNIQAGLYRARTLLTESQAQNKAIVLLSDGEPTYSYEASSAAAHTWPDNKYKFLLSKFDYRESIGSGDDYGLSYFDQYTVNGYEVKDNGIGTLSEAKSTIDAGINIYSIGLDVDNNSNADYVLKNIQNKGYYPSDSSDLNKIFAELASKLAFAAENAIVTDPMGDMFNLQMKGSTISESDYKASQGTVSWNANTETFTWNVGNIVEKTPATLTYKVYMDQSKNPDPNKLYPTNKKTTMNYTDANKQPTAKDFEVPLVSYGKGSILVKGYKVNANGDPINSKGETVGRPDLAEQLYSGYFKVDDKESLDIGKTYSVPAPKVQNHDLKVGTNPTSVELTMSKPSPTIWFGFIDAPSKLAIVHRAGDKVLEKSSVDKALGESVEVGSKTFPGYQFTDVVVSEGSGLKVSDGRVTGVMPGKDVTITFNYTSSKQSVTVKYLEKDTKKVLEKESTLDGVTGEKVTLEAKQVPGYKPVNKEYEYTFVVEGNEYIFYYTKDDPIVEKRTVFVHYVDRESNKVLKESTHYTDKVGTSIALTAEDITLSNVKYQPENYSHNHTVTNEAEQQYTFYYNKVNQGEDYRVTVNYVEQATKAVLQKPTFHTGKVGGILELKADRISVSDAVYSPLNSNYSYKITDSIEQQYTFYYVKGDLGDVQSLTVKHLERGTNAELKPPSLEKGKLGESILIKPTPITSVTGAVYNPEQPSYEHTFTSTPNQELSIYYTKDASQTEHQVTVKYLEQGTGRQLAEPTTKSGIAGKTVSLNAVTVSGYTPVKSSNTYTFTNGKGQEYIFYYTAEKRTVTVKYLEKDTNKVLEKESTLDGVTGEKVKLEAKQVPGYKPVNKEHEYIFVVEGNVYIFYYTKELGDVQSLTVKHLERGTNAELKPPSLEKGKLGESILIKPTPITSVTGAVYNPEQPSYEHTFTSKPNQELSIYYTKDASQTEHQVTVKYLEQGTGRQLAEPTTKSGIAGKTVNLNAVTVSGYTPVKSSNTYTFTNGKGQEYIFYYTRNVTTNPDTGSPGGSSGGGSSYVAPTSPLKPPPEPPKLEKKAHYNYINGYPDGMVKPENLISREEVAAIFYRLMESQTRINYMSDKHSYSDVAGKRWSNKHISTMENAGIIKGYLDGTFNPGRSITRAEFAAIASRFDKLDGQSNTTFTDVSGHWAEKYIVSAANKGWIKGYTDRTFKPNQYITRAEAMAFINSVLDRKVKVDGIHKDAKKWPDNTPNSWYYRDVLEATNYHEYKRLEDGSEKWDQVNPDIIYP